MSTTPRSIRWAPRAERGTVLHQPVFETNGECSIKADSECQPTLRRRRSFSEFLLHHKKKTATEDKNDSYESLKSKGWIRYHVKKLVTQLSPSKRREVRHMKSEGAIGSLYNANLEQRIEVSFQGPTKQPPDFAEISIQHPPSKAKLEVLREPVSRNANAIKGEVRKVTKGLENTPGTVQWQDLILQLSRPLRAERREIPFINEHLVDWILEDSLLLRSQSVELAKYPLVEEFNSLFMPDDAVTDIFQGVKVSPMKFGSGNFEITLFNTRDPIDTNALSLDLFYPCSDNSSMIKCSRLTTPSITAQGASDDDDEYDAAVIAKNYALSRSSKTIESDPESPGIIVMDNLQYYTLDESSSSDDSLDSTRLDFPLQSSVSEFDDNFMFGQNTLYTRRRNSSTGLRKVSKKISLVDFFQTQGILKTKPTLQNRSSAPTKRHEFSQHVDNTNIIADYREESEKCNIPCELIDNQQLLRRLSTASTEVDLNFGQPLERFPRKNCGKSMCNIRYDGSGKKDSNLEPIFRKPVATYPRLGNFTWQPIDDDANL